MMPPVSFNFILKDVSSLSATDIRQENNKGICLYLFPIVLREVQVCD